MIYCIGDSHSAVFSGEEKMQPVWPEFASNKLPYFKSYRIGPATAYQLHNKKLIIESLLNSLNLTSEDTIMFCFGEVDVRAHLIKQSILQNKSIEKIVNECVLKYIDNIKYYKKYGVNILCWGVIASWNESKPYNGPSYGTNIERNSVTKIFNNILENACISEKFGYISIFSDMVNTDGSTKEEFLDDWEGSHIHLSQRVMPIILEKFKTVGLI
jgi:hypothetical protein